MTVSVIRSVTHRLELEIDDRIGVLLTFNIGSSTAGIAYDGAFSDKPSTGGQTGG